MRGDIVGVGIRSAGSVFEVVVSVVIDGVEVFVISGDGGGCGRSNRALSGGRSLIGVVGVRGDDGIGVGGFTDVVVAL